MIRLRVKEVAKAKGISMAKLSRLADLSPKTVQALWHDPYRDVAVSTLDKIAKALHVDVSKLVESVPENADKDEA
jgi:DNA-binding Xre family transcriptional regulator